MEDEQKKIPLLLTIKEINVLFKALGDRPFKEVYELFGKMNTQVNDYLAKEEKE
jgi:hypothetical protein